MVRVILVKSQRVDERLMKQVELTVQRIKQAYAWYVVYILFLLLVVPTTSQEVQGEEKDEKATVPTREQSEKIDSIVDEAIKSLLTKAAGDSTGFAKQGIGLFHEEGDLTTKWVLGIRLFEQLGEFDAPLQMLEIITNLDSEFEIKDFSRIYTNFLKLDAKNRKEHLGKRLSTLGPILTIGRLAARNGDTSTVGKIASYDLIRVPPEVRPSFQSALNRLKQSSAKNSSIAEVVQSALDKLKENPEDGNALAILGTTRILVDQKTPEGIALLVKSTAKSYQEIGELERIEGKTNDQLFELASKWWSVSEKMPNSLKDLAQRRGAEIYLKCFDGLRGINKVVAEKRMSEIVIIDNGKFPLRIDLLGTTVRRRIHNGEMKESEKKLFLRSAGPSYVQFEIPYSSDYDVEYRFSRTRTEWGVAFFFFHSDHQFMWSFSGAKHNWIGFSGMKYPEGKDFGIRKELPDGQHTLLLRIHSDKFEAVVDGNIENVIESPLSLEKVDVQDHPAEMKLPFFSVLDWWGDTMIDSATLTQYW
jgi:hypothetical protein